MVSSSLGVINAKDFWEALQKGRHGQTVRIVPVMRTIGIELWLRNLSNQRFSVGAGQDAQEALKRLVPAAISAEKT